MKAPLPETKLNYIKASFTQYIITNNKDFMKKMKKISATTFYVLVTKKVNS